ncbi:MAG: neutral zinc metallopeptidase, partial [Deltaproteobacteria bacterium]
MQWRGRRQSRNIEDRRGMSGGSVAGIGGIGALIIIVIGALLGVDVTPLLEGGGQIQNSGPVEITEADQQAGEFVAVTLADTEAVWTDIFAEQGIGTYDPATLVLYKGGTQSACGGASMQTGPFYCPVDKKVYLDTDFFTVMRQRLGAGGDFAAAYVVAHEIGHHVQDELGILEKTTAYRQQVDQTTSNQISVLVELQADCYAGIWAR